MKPVAFSALSRLMTGLALGKAGLGLTTRVTGRGGHGLNARGHVTDGGPSGTNGVLSARWRSAGLLTLLAFLVLGLAYLVVNATSMIDMRSALGRPVDAWRPWIWEATSYLAWLALVPVVIWLAARIGEQERPGVMLGLHALATLPVSLGHSAMMFGMRVSVYLVLGETYRLPGSILDSLVYEFRKDVVTYAFIVLTWHLLRHLLARPATMPTPQPSQAPRFEIRQGNRIIWLNLAEIDWISAAGNYIELHGAFGTHLIRRPLGDVEAELSGHGFARVHRSRLVRKGAINGLETRQSGDFDITLHSGQKIGGSRRYRAEVA
jgi:hypothetical protein